MPIAPLAYLALLALVGTGAQQDDEDVGDQLFDDGLDALLDGDWAADEPGTDARGAGAIPLRSLKGFIETRVRSYLDDRNRGRHDAQFLIEGELELEFALGSSWDVYLRPRFRVDLVDPDAARFEPFEAYAGFSAETWDLRVGQFVENWGIVDTFNPIDIINRRDFSSDFLDPDRLGELGVRLRRHFDGNEVFGEPTWSLYALPFFRETPFPTEGSRFSFAGSGLTFEETPGLTPHGSERTLIATRLQSTLRTSAFNADLQLLLARGPERFPLVLPSGASTLAPFYYGAVTTGGGLRAVPNAKVLGSFLATLTLKAEVVSKTPFRFDNAPYATPDSYVQYVLGVDRLFPNVWIDNDRLTLMIEYAGESGANDAASALRPFQSDVVARAFWEQGDFSRTSFELRAIVDTELDERVYESIFERQLRAVHEDLKWFVQLQVFDADDDEGLFSMFPDNTSISAGLRFEL